MNKIIAMLTGIMLTAFMAVFSGPAFAAKANPKPLFEVGFSNSFCTKNGNTAVRVNIRNITTLHHVAIVQKKANSDAEATGFASSISPNSTERFRVVLPAGKVSVIDVFQNNDELVGRTVRRALLCP